MKSYLQGLITGGVFVFATMVLLGSTTNESKLTEYKIIQAMTSKKVTKLVNEQIQTGWKPVGSCVKVSTSLYEVIVK